MIAAIHLQNTGMLLLLWTLPVFVAFYLYAAQKRRHTLVKFAQVDLLKHINTSISVTRRRWKATMVIAAVALVAFALARPGWNPKPTTLKRTGRDVVFVLDVSRSMLAEDLAPNRLERAKLAIVDCIERLRGDRVGLVAFAGSAVVKCPLTLDYGFFRLMLEDTSPKSVSRGGTMIGDAIRTTLDQVFDDREKKFKDVILITDGEDHDSFAESAAEQAGQRGVRILAIGLGDENEGRRIPITDEAGNKTFLKYKGEEIWSKLDGDTLRKMVNQTPGGKYLNVATNAVDLGEVYTKLISTAEKKELEAKTIERYEEKYQIFMTLAFVLLCGEIVVSERRKNATA